MILYLTRYAAEKEKRGNERIIKVTGGYAIMTVQEYNNWRKQK